MSPDELLDKVKAAMPPHAKVEVWYDPRHPAIRVSVGHYTSKHTFDRFVLADSEHLKWAIHSWAREVVWAAHQNGELYRDMIGSTRAI